MRGLSFLSKNCLGQKTSSRVLELLLLSSQSPFDGGIGGGGRLDNEDDDMRWGWVIHAKEDIE
jgi:hypothetical protein